MVSIFVLFYLRFIFSLVLCYSFSSIIAFCLLFVCLFVDYSYRIYFYAYNFFFCFSDSLPIICGHVSPLFFFWFPLFAISFYVRNFVSILISGSMAKGRIKNEREEKEKEMER